MVSGGGRKHVLSAGVNTIVDLWGRRRTSVRGPEKPAVDSSILSLGTIIAVTGSLEGWTRPAFAWATVCRRSWRC